MTGLDWTLVGFAVIIIGIQTVRGAKEMGIIFFEMLALVPSVVFTQKWYLPVSKFLGIHNTYSYILSFIVIATVTILIVKVLTRTAEVNFPPFDAFFSFICGIVISWAFLYVILRFLLLFSSLQISTEPPTINKRVTMSELIGKSAVAQEIFEFKIFRYIEEYVNRYNAKIQNVEKKVNENVPLNDSGEIEEDTLESEGP